MLSDIMFKRITKHNERLEKDREEGLAVGHEAPPEMAIDDDSDSDSESENEAEIDDDDKHSEGSDSGSNASDDEDDQDDEESQSESGAGSDTEEEEEEEEPFAITRALQEPIYTRPDAPLKKGQPHRSCVICPLAALKDDASVTVHLKSNVSPRRRTARCSQKYPSELTVPLHSLLLRQTHHRRLKRFTNRLSKLPDNGRKTPEEGGTDAKKVVAMCDEILKKQEEQLAAKRKEKEERKKRKRAEKVEKVSVIC